MRAFAVVVFTVGVCGAVVSAATGAAASGRQQGAMISVASEVTRIAAAGDSVAIQSLPPANPAAVSPALRSCTEAWNSQTGTVTRFLNSLGCTWNEFSDWSHVAFDGDRLVWSSGPKLKGRTYSWTVQTATIEHPAPRYVTVDGHRVVHGPDLTDPVAGAGPIVFAYIACKTSRCPPPLKEQIELFRINGATAMRIAKSSGPLFPRAGDAGRILVIRGPGRFDIDRTDGSTIISFAASASAAPDGSYPPLQACMQGNDIALLGYGRLAHYDATTGAVLGTHPLSLGTLDGCANGIVATAWTNTITLTRLSDGATATITADGTASAERGGSPDEHWPVAAALDSAGLFYAWNVNDPTNPGRVAFIPFDQLPLH